MKRAPPPEVWRLKFRDSPAHWSDEPPVAKYAYAATRYVPETALREEKKRLRKQVADLKARLRLWRDALAHAETLSGQLPLTVEQLLRPTKPHYFDLLKLKSWRKGGE